MIPDYADRKKDKRLLVLLALGMFIILTDLVASGSVPSESHDYRWLEVHGKRRMLYRIDLNDIGDTAEYIFHVSRAVSPLLLSKPVFERLRQSRVVAIRHERGGAKSVSVAPVSPSLAYVVGQPFSLNDASAEELALIPGIGPALAGRIVAYRKLNGPIAPYLIEEVRGIGPHMKKRLQKYCTYSIDGK